MFEQTKQGVCFRVNVIVKASQSEMVEWSNDELKIRLAAVPEKGRANGELCCYLAAFFGVGKSNIQLLRGLTSRHKQVCIMGISLEDIQSKVQRCLSKRK
ncbi:MAG: DUF167 domain-containing protein [Parachlamydiaceae bacterium]